MDCIKVIVGKLKLFLNEHGASAVEYSVLAALIIAGLVLTIVILGGKTQDLFQTVVTVWNSVNGS